MSAYDAIARLYDPWSRSVIEDVAFYVGLARESDGVRAFWTARPEGTGPSVPVLQVHTVVRTALRPE